MPFETRKEIHVSVPCRVDFGGTLDISTFYLPLGQARPATFNLALNLRTHVILSPWEDGMIRMESRGFDPAEFPAGEAPYAHPMGLMFAVADFFNASGVRIRIDSESPPRSALGGSSSAAVALAAAFIQRSGRSICPKEAALVAHFIESSVAGVPCGLQDQLAAAYGGVNQWYWTLDERGPGFVREPLIRSSFDRARINESVLIAYGGRTHVSSDVNSRWVKEFLSGKNHDTWRTIVDLTHRFSAAMKAGAFNEAAELMNQETLLRLGMTPDVLDDTGRKLFELAEGRGCGARFTGAGGGGCVWAVGPCDAILKLKQDWLRLISRVPSAALLETAIDPDGIKLL